MLIILRLVTALYLAINFGLIVYCDLTEFQEGWSSVFQFPNIAYFLQLLYQWIALVSSACSKVHSQCATWSENRANLCRCGHSCISTIHNIHHRARLSAQNCCLRHARIRGRITACSSACSTPLRLPSHMLRLSYSGLS